jgi:hypothetical protein
MNPDLLEQLKDIHGAPPLPWWPPAPGWWILAAMLLLVLIWVGSRALKRYRIHQRRKQMLAWIDHLNATIDPQKEPQSYLSTINRIFKVVALRAYPEEQVAVMAGSQWAEFLQQQMKKNQQSELLAVLSSGPYNPAPEFDPATISDLARLWIKQHG